MGREDTRMGWAGRRWAGEVGTGQHGGPPGGMHWRGGRPPAAFANSSALALTPALSADVLWADLQMMSRGAAGESVSSTQRQKQQRLWAARPAALQRLKGHPEAAAGVQAAAAAACTVGQAGG